MKLLYTSHSAAEANYNHLKEFKAGLNRVEVYFLHKGAPCLYDEPILLDDSITGRMNDLPSYRDAILKGNALEEGFDYFVIIDADDLTESDSE